MSVKYQQLDAATLNVLREQVQKHGAVGPVARKLGYSRPAVSGALNGSYGGGTAKLRARIYEVFVEAVFCPHLGEPMPSDECRWWRTSPCPTSSPASAQHWLACKTCIFNPDRKEPIP